MFFDSALRSYGTFMGTVMSKMLGGGTDFDFILQVN